MVGIAFAMGQGGGAEQGAGSGFAGLIPFILMFVIFYFLLILPQQKKQKKHQEMLRSIKKGDRIITGGGIYGRVTSADDSTLTVEIADKVRVKVTRGSVGGLVESSAKEEETKEEEATKSKLK